MKYLTALFCVFTVIMLAVGINTAKHNRVLEASGRSLSSEVNDLDEQIYSVSLFGSRAPEEILTTYSKFIEALTSFNHELGLDIKARIRGIEDYQTISEAIQPSEIAGVNRVVFLLESPSELPATLHAISGLQEGYPLLFHELHYEQGSAGVVFSLYGI